MDEVIRRFNDHAIRYLLIGGQAVRLESKKRANRPSDAADIEFLEARKKLGLLR